MRDMLAGAIAGIVPRERAAFRLEPGAKRAVTFLRATPKARLKLPIELDGARILRVKGREVFRAYVPSPKRAVLEMVRRRMR